MQPEQELMQVKGIVEEILSNDERARNDDKYLTFKVMQRYTKIYIPFEDFNKIPAFESIKRMRALIQNKEGRYLPTDDKVREERLKKSIALRRFFATVKGDCI